METVQDKIALRYKEDRFSVKQIAKEFGMSSSTVTRILDSKSVSRRNISEAIRCLNVTKFGKKEFILKSELSSNDELLKVSGIMLYWGEGSKRGNTVAFSNSDPEMVRVFLMFLRIICGVDENRLHASIHYYEDHDPGELRRFWSEVTHIPECQFYKSVLHRRRATGTYRKPSIHGTISVQYADSRLLAVILEWIHEYPRSFAGI